MSFLDKVWDDVMAGPQPESGLDKLRRMRVQTTNLNNTNHHHQSNIMAISPGTPATPTTPATRKENVWRSVFHPGSNLNTRNIGSQIFDKPTPHSTSPTVYDWLYSGETKSKHV